MKRIPILLALMLAVPAPAALAEKPVLIELFASQNCAACPKAHSTLKAVQAERGDNVLVLTWAVDYWDYLGSPDPMAIPAAADRQSAYTDRFGIRAPYTPQSVYDGAVQCPATRKKTVEANIKARDERAEPDAISIATFAGGFSLDGQTPQPADVRLVEYLPEGGNPTGMVNPVTSSHLIGVWTGGHVTYDYSCSHSCAVVVQQPGHGEVYGVHALQ